jgi:acetolactate synthase-1/2/3 large subunit
VIFAQALENEKAPIHPYRLASAIAETVEHDAVIIADGGETSSWMDMAAQVQVGGHWLSHGYLGCRGTGMPFAIAAKMAHPDREVVCIIGDGSVGLNFAEFDTMVRHQLPIVVVVNNDQQWGMSAHGQELIYGKERRVATDLAPTRYDLAAEGFGCHAEHVVEPADLVPALRRALDCGRPACVNVMTDPEVISPVTLAMVGGAGAGGGAAESEGGEGSITIPYYDDLDQ